jgi:TM2 domain-containing membrane protein YozV
MSETYAPVPVASQASPKNLLAATLLCFFLGTLGVHRFYTGKIGTGILMIVTLGAFGIWTLVDLIMLVCGAFKDKEGLPLKWQ